MQSSRDLQMDALTLDGPQRWTYQNLVEVPLSSASSDWRLLSDLSQAEQEQVKNLNLDQDRRFPGIVNGRTCAIVEQEFQARDSGDEWPESVEQVKRRLLAHLLPRLSPYGVDGAVIGILGDPTTTFCGRPTVWVAVPSDRATASNLNQIEQTLRDFAYPSTCRA